MKKIVMLVFVSLFFLSVMLPISKETTSFSETTIYVNPSTNYVSVGNTFVINVSVADITDLLSFRFHLGYNTTILDGLNVWLPPPFETPIQPQIIDPDGYIHVNALSPIPLSGSSTLASITFNATAVGSSILDLYDTILLDSTGNLSHTIVDGSVTVSSAIITVPDDYPTIQEAIDASGLGDTIQVAAGVYYERLTVNKTVTLMGEDPLTTIIDGDVDVINVSNVVISRFTIIHLHGDGILLEHCRDSIINNNVIEGAGRYAIDLLYSEGNIFTNNSVLDSRDGVALFESNQNFFINNKISRNHKDGILIVESGNNFFSGNTISENWESGITLITQYACGNIFEGNTISKNDYGILIADAYDNAAYHNNFIDNRKQIIAYNETNIWDAGYPSGGNYWSSHNPPDLYGGPYQNETGSDGIGDEPYILEENNIDRYPLIYPYGYVPSPDVNGDEIVDIFDVVTVAEAFGSIPGDPKWNPITDLVQDGLIDIFDVVTVAGNFGKLLDA